MCLKTLVYKLLLVIGAKVVVVDEVEVDEDVVDEVELVLEVVDVLVDDVVIMTISSR